MTYFYAFLGLILGAILTQITYPVIGSIVIQFCATLFAVGMFFNKPYEELVTSSQSYLESVEKLTTEVENISKCVDSTLKVEVEKLTETISRQYVEGFEDKAIIDIERVGRDLEHRISGSIYRFLPFNEFLREFNPKQKASYVDALLTNDWRTVNAIVKQLTNR